MNSLNYNRNLWYRTGIYAIIAVFWGYIAFKYASYMNIAKSTVPIMDFWEWIYVYGQKILDGSVSIADFFNSDAGQHIQPLCMAINFWVLKASHFDVVPLVWGGMILRGLISALVIVTFLWRVRMRNDGVVALSVQAVCAIAIIMAVFNYNQWEMTAEPFGLTNAFRIGNYLMTFYLTDVFLRGLGKRKYKASLVQGALLGLYCALLTVFVSAAYFVGHLIAIGIAMLWVLIQNRGKWKRYLLPMILWGGPSFIAACIYYILVSGRSAAGVPMVELKEYIRLIIEGVCMFWGAMFVHINSIGANGVALVTVLGTLNLVYAVFITNRYLHLRLDGGGMFPVICVCYAIIISVVVSFGRVIIWGSEIMTSSRYVTESVIGLIGVLWMSCEVYAHRANKKGGWLGPVACGVIAIALMIWVANVENATAPYRKIYNDNLAEMMMNMDDYTDDELGVFQANSPEYVRYSVAFFEENNLSIFKEIGQ